MITQIHGCGFVEWQKASLFISSTFDDMHAERDYLIKEVFPELEDWAEKRRVRLTEIDLRWGITEEESKSKGTVGTCLMHIDKCRPFFICFLGQKIGWIPDFEVDINEKTKYMYPTLKDMVNNKSLTEIEIDHSLFSPLPHRMNDELIACHPTEYNLFFFRHDNYTDNLTDEQKAIYTNVGNPDLDERLSMLKNKILDLENDSKVNVKVNEYCGIWDGNLRQSELSAYGNSADKGRLINFKCGEKSLKEVIICELKEQIMQAFPQNTPMEYGSRIIEDNDHQDIFIYKNNEDYIERSNYLASVKEYVRGNENLPFLISAPSGYGKTMLLSKFVSDFKDDFPDKKLIKRFCATSNFTSQPYSLWKSIVDEIGISSESKYYPHDFDELKSSFKNVLESISKSGDYVIVIDSINQVPNGIDMIEWFGLLPSNLKVIISITDDKKSVMDNASKHSLFLDELNDDEKRDLIKTYLKNYLKELDEKEIETICKTEGSKNPLYLNILLSELRVFGSFDQLESKIKKFGQTPESAFNHVLQRLEEDEKLKGKEEIVPLMFYLLSNSSKGLTENELASLIKDKTDLDEKYILDTVRLFLRQIHPFMVKKEGRYDFLYQSFKIAVRSRYYEKFNY